MSQHYSDESRADDKWSLPDIEIFYRDGSELVECTECNDESMHDCLACNGTREVKEQAGWYYWFCLPGCMPDSDAFGPYDTEQLALDAARDF